MRKRNMSVIPGETNWPFVPLYPMFFSDGIQNYKYAVYSGGPDLRP